MITKQVSLQDAIKSIPNNATIGIGGNTLNRSPLALTREIVRQQKSHLQLVKTAGALDIDMLCLAGLVQSVDAGFISFETQYGLANNYRKSVQQGIIKANEHACYTVMSALRASQANVGFMPVYGLKNSDLIKVNDYFTVIKDPFTNEDITVVKALTPDYAIIHVHACDASGNAEIIGPRYDDILLAKASKKVILSTERIVPNTYFKNNPRKVDIPGLLVDKIVLVPNGAKPGAMAKKYTIDDKAIKDYQSLQNKNELYDYLDRFNRIDHKTVGWRYGN